MVSISFVVDVKGCVSDQTHYFVANSSVTWLKQVESDIYVALQCLEFILCIFSFTGYFLSVL